MSPRADCADAEKVATYLGLLWLANLSAASVSACGEGICRTDLYIGLYARTLPIAFRDWVDRSTERHADGEVVARRLTLNGMGSATGSFADDGGAFLCLQIEGELFAAGEGLGRGEHVHGLIDKARAGNPGERPVLMRLVFVPVGK